MNHVAERTIAFMIVALLLASGVSAFGISPGTKTIVYGIDDPAFEFRPVLEKGESGRITVRTEGNLEEYLAMTYGELTSEAIRGRILPLPDLPPGRHTQYIVVGLIPEGGGTVGAVTEVGASLHIEIPYPAAYLEGNYELSRNDASGAMTLTLMLRNLGSAEVTPTAMEFSLEKDGVPGPQGTFTPSQIVSGQYGKFRSTFPKASNGVHDTTVLVRYEGKELLMTKELSVGNPVILINEFSYAAEEQGVIKPITIDADIGWNRELPVTLKVFLDNRTMPEFTETLILKGAFEHIFYLDTSTTPEPGRLVLTIQAGGTTETEEISAREELSSTGILVLVLLLILILLAGAIILAILVRREQKKP